MGEYYVGAKSKKLIALLKKFGCTVSEGGRHYKATAPSGNSVPIPRHKELSNGVVEDICRFLLEEGCNKELIDRYIK
jgi:hypothetical protein